MKIDKVVRIGTVKDGDCYARIQFADGKLSISGAIGPMRNGNARGSAGQWIMSFREYDARGHMNLAEIEPAPQWGADKIKRFLDIWDRWHLNDMQSGTPRQMEYLRDHPVPKERLHEHYVAACEILKAGGLYSDNGYRYGTAWLREDVPSDVLAFLQSLPETDMQPAWV